MQDDGLDFSELSDDQVVELAVALAREAMSRNPALQAAFAQALLDERARVEAAARGSARARQQEAERIERQAQAARENVARERERRRVHAALSAYLRAGAQIIGQRLENVVLVWDTDTLQARGSAPKLRININKQAWSLVEYDVRGDAIHMSPGIRSKEAEIMPWCREVAAAATALDIKKTTKVPGREA